MSEAAPLRRWEHERLDREYGKGITLPYKLELIRILKGRSKTMQSGIDAAQPKQSDNSSSLGSKTTEEILAERGKVYGDFTTHAQITQRIKTIIFEYNTKLTEPQLEALEMIAHKIGRILNGDPNYRDSWDDIAGYAKLAAERCRQP